MSPIYTPTALEQAADKPIPPADELAGTFHLISNTNPASQEHLDEVLANPGFGDYFTDHMALAEWRHDGGWVSKEVRPYGPFPMDPADSVLHYGQEVFEGIKAYRWSDGSIWTFRPRFNAARLNHSARMLALPELPEEDFLASLVDYVRADARWVPSQDGQTLYMRPFMFASEDFLGVRPSLKVTYSVIGSPSGPYFDNGFQPVSIWVTKEHHRAGVGGTGSAKTGGNYAASLRAQELAYDKGYQQVCFLNTDYTTLEELGGMNVFVVADDGSVLTPTLEDGTILEGGTRSSIIRLLGDNGHEVIQTRIVLDELVDGIKSGKYTEFFACGTAAVVAPIGKFGGDDFTVELPAGPVTTWVHDTLTGIQFGRVPDPYNWMYRLL